MKQLPARYLHRIGVALALALFGAACAAYVRHVHWARTAAVLHQAALPLVVAATACHFVSLFAKAGAWLVCLRAVGAVRFWTVARATLVGATLNSLLVANSGDAGRTVIMTRATGLPVYTVLTTVAVERLLNMLGFAVMVGMATMIAPLPRVVARGLLVAGAAAALAVWLGFRSRGDTRRTAGRRSGRGRRVARLLRVRLRRAARTARRVVTPRRLAIASPLTMMDWTFQLVSYHLVAQAAHLPISVPGSLLALLAVNLGLVIRVTPGNVGVFELAYASAAHALGAPMDAAIGVGMLIHLAQDLPTIVLGLALGHRLVFATSRSLAWPAPRRAAPAANPSCHGGIVP